jgi:hypothetical protein
MSEVNVKANSLTKGISISITGKYVPDLEKNNEIPGWNTHVFLEYLPNKSREELEALLEKTDG